MSNFKALGINVSQNLSVTGSAFIGQGTTSDVQVLVMSGGAPASTDEGLYTDVNFFVSGTIGSKNSAVKGTSLFGGDVVISGTLYAENTVIEVNSVADGDFYVTGNMYVEPDVDSRISVSFRKADGSPIFIVDSTNSRIGLGEGDPDAILDIKGFASSGVPTLLIDHNDTDKIALDINAANIDADVIDITSDALTTHNVIDVSADGLQTGKILNLISDSSHTGTRQLVTIHNDNTAAVNTTALHITNDAIAATNTVVIESTAAETNPLLELKNSNAATDKPPILAFNRSDTTSDADDMSIGTIQFNGTDGGDNETVYANIAAIASDITNNDEGGKVVVSVLAGGTAGTAASTNLLSIGGEDAGNGTRCEVVINDAGINSNFRVESSDETHMLFVDAATSRVSIGDSDNDPAATLEVTNHASAGAYNVPLLQLNSNDVDQIALDINAANTTANIIDITSDTLTSGKVINIDIEQDTTAAVTNELIKIDFDKTGVTADTNTAMWKGLRVDMSDSQTNHAGSTVSLTGMEIMLDHANLQGTTSNLGLDIRATDADTNVGLQIRVTDSTGTDIKLLSDADPADFATIAVGNNGATTFATVDGGAEAANLTLDADGKIIIEAFAGDEAVFNEAGLDVDFRVESAVRPGAILLDSGTEQLALLSKGSTASTAYADNISATGRTLPLDIALFVSGAMSGKGVTAGNRSKGTAVFGGDTVVSGSLATVGVIMTPQNYGNVSVPVNFNAIIAGPEVSVDGTISISAGAVLTILD